MLSDWQPASSTGTVGLIWNYVGIPGDFEIQRATNGSTAWSTIANPAITGGPSAWSYTETVGEGTYTYRVSAIKDGVPAGFSTSNTLVVAEPADFMVTATAVSSSRVDVSWTPLTNGTTATLSRSASGGAFVDIASVSPSGAGTYSDFAVTPGATYQYKLTVSNALATKFDDSNVVTVPGGGGSSGTTNNVQIPQGVSGVLVFTYESLGAGITVPNGFGLVKRNPTGEATYVELLDTDKRTVGTEFYRVPVEGGEVLELYVQANKGDPVETGISRKTYSSDGTKNADADPTVPDHLGTPLQDAQQQQDHIWSLRWELPRSTDASFNGAFDDLTIKLQVQQPCNGTTIPCPDEGVALSTHTASNVDLTSDAFAPASAPGIGANLAPDPTGGQGNPTPLGIRSVLGGRIDTLRWSFVQESTDFSLAGPGEIGVCPECGPGQISSLIYGGLPTLKVNRIHRPRAEAWPSSFGRGVFSNFDVQIAFRPQGIGNQPSAELFDPALDGGPRTFVEISALDSDNQVNGVYYDTASRTFSKLELLDASSNLQPDPFLATQAVVTTLDGRKLRFEMLDIEQTGLIASARLTAIEDRNGNATVISYKHPAASPTLGDRRELWHIDEVTDAFGRSATFTYQYRSASDRWVATSIAMPDATSRGYVYGTSGGNVDRLIQVQHPNGDVSNFDRTWDTASQTWALKLEDAAGGVVGTWKTVFVSGDTYTPSGGAAVAQEPNLVRRVVNKDGEQVYEATEDPNNLNVTYFQEGGDRLIRMTTNAAGVPTEVARAVSVTSDPKAATFVKLEGYDVDSAGLIRGATSFLQSGGVLIEQTRVFTRDPRTRALTGLKAIDGTTSSSTFNNFNQPTDLRDRLNRETAIGYDAKGNPKSVTLAPGTAEQEGWTYNYNAAGQITQIIDPRGNVEDRAYDTAGRLVTVTAPPDEPGGPRAVTTFEWDSLSRLSGIVDPEGRRVTLTWDSRQRLTRRTYPDGTYEETTYGSGAKADLVISERNRNGVMTTFDYDSSRRRIEVVQAAGRPEQTETTYQYLPGTNLISAEVQNGERTEYGYDTRQRRVSRKVYANGSTSLTWTTAYDDQDRVASETDPYGRKTFYAYDVNGRRTRTVQELVPGGVPAGSNIASLNRVLSTNPPYVIEDTEFNAMNLVVATVDRRGYRTEFEYDQRGRQRAVWEAVDTADERLTEYRYDVAGNLVTEVLPRAHSEDTTLETVSTYNGRNLLKTRTVASGKPEAATSSYTYTLAGQTKIETDPRGGEKEYTYEALTGRVHEVFDEIDEFVIHAYDGVGNLLLRVDRFENSESTTYDGLNRVLTQTNKANETTTFTYDDDLTDGVGIDADPVYASHIDSLGFGANANGSAVKTTNAELESTLSVRDGLGRSVMSISPSGKVSRTTYDEVVSGLVQQTSYDPLNQTSKVLSDGAGNTRKTIDAAGQETVRTFDAGGNVVNERDPNNVGQDCTYDALGRRKSCTDTQGDPTSWTYDAHGNVLATTDGEEITRTCTYDFRDRKKTCRDGNNQPTTWEYDGNSNITKITDAENRETIYTYDPRNFRETATYPDSTGVNDKVTTEHDLLGRLWKITDQAGNVRTLTYDLADRLKTKTDPDGEFDSFNYDAAGRPTRAYSSRYNTEVVRTYDLFGRLSGEHVAHDYNPEAPSSESVLYGYDAADRVSTVTYPDGTAVTKTYDVRNLLEFVKIGSATVVQYGRDAGGRTRTKTFGNGMVETVNYRADNTVNSITNPVVGDLAYTYDGAKRKRSETGSATNGSQTFGYDTEGRMTAWSGGAGGADTQGWALTAVGNWDSTTRNSVLEDRDHNTGHELTSVNGVPVAHDARGNILTDDLGNQMEWDFENKLEEFTTSGGLIVRYDYDAFGRKLVRHEGDQLTWYMYDGEEVITEYRAADNNEDVVNFFLGEELDKPVAYSVDGVMRYYSSNHVGSVTAVTDASGAVVERYRYSSYGARTVLSAAGVALTATTVGNHVGFTGREHDSRTGLMDFRFRWFNPRLGRFVSRDDEYRDGMLLYGAYFVPSGRDPSGHSTSGNWEAITDELVANMKAFRAAAAAQTLRYQAAGHFEDKTALPSDGTTGTGRGWDDSITVTQRVGSSIALDWLKLNDRNGLMTVDHFSTFGGGSSGLGQRRKERERKNLMDKGFSQHKDPVAAAEQKGQEAHNKTCDSAPSSADQKEYGAMIFKYDGAYWTAPLTEGKSLNEARRENPDRPYPSVSVDKMLQDMAEGADGAGVDLGAVTVVGMVHSHPTQAGVSEHDKMVHNIYATSRGETRKLAITKMVNGNRMILGIVNNQYSQTHVYGPARQGQSTCRPAKRYTHP